MKAKSISAILSVGLWISLLLVAASTSNATARDLKLEAQLIWGTNDPKSPNPSHKPVQPGVRKKLKSLPFKWENYFEVNRVQFDVPEAGQKSVAMSADCTIKVRNLGDSMVEVSLIGKGKLVSKITQALPKSDLLVTGGDAENLTAWFVVLGQVE